MGLFNVFKKREVPSELPSLSLDEPVKSIESQYNSIKPIAEVKEESSKYKPLPVQKIENWNSVELKALTAKSEDDKGFFKELIKDLTNEISSEKLDIEYKEKILGDDIVTQMKSYWERQRPEVFLQNAGKEIKDQLVKKAENLNELEKEWQSAYFSLIAKEEKIRQEEKELKQMLSELIGIYEKSLTHKARKSEKKHAKS